MILFNGTHGFHKELDPRKASDDSNYGKGIYLTQSVSLARRYARPWFYIVYVKDELVRKFDSPDSVAIYFDEVMDYVLKNTGVDLMGDDYAKNAIWRMTGEDEGYGDTKEEHEILRKAGSPREIIATILYDMKKDDCFNISSLGQDLNEQIMIYKDDEEPIKKACEEFDAILDSYAVNVPNSQQSDDVYIVKDKNVMQILVAMNTDDARAMIFDDKFKELILKFCHKTHLDDIPCDEDKMLYAALETILDNYPSRLQTGYQEGGTE